MVRGPGIGGVGGGGLGARQPFVIAAAGQFGKAFLPQDLGHRDGRAGRAFLFQGFANVVHGQVLLAQPDNLFPHRLVGLDPGPCGIDKERTFWLAAKLVDELLKTTRGISEASGDFGAGELIDEIGPQGLVLAVRRVLRSEKNLSQIH